MTLAEFRAEKDRFFRSHRQSPLSRQQQERFTGLRYFPENPELAFTLNLDTSVPHDEIVMQTTIGDQQRYVRAGRITFTVDGREAALSLYEMEPGGKLFLPFRDATCGHETYGAGRYLEAAPAEDGAVHIDFNLAYNPYCAYNENWSCPIPPVENWLAVPIRAGELAYEEHETSEEQDEA